MVSVSYYPLQLYRSIERVILAQTEDQYPIATIYDQEQSLYLFRQENLTSAQWYERFNTKIDVGTAIGVTRQHEALLNYCANEHTAGETYDTLAGATSSPSVTMLRSGTSLTFSCVRVERNTRI